MNISQANSLGCSHLYVLYSSTFKKIYQKIPRCSNNAERSFSHSCDTGVLCAQLIFNSDLVWQTHGVLYIQPAFVNPFAKITMLCDFFSSMHPPPLKKQEKPQKYYQNSDLLIYVYFGIFY